jgi:hypothetical protein
MTFPNTTAASQAVSTAPELTQEILLEALNQLIAQCHDGRVRKGCGEWYKQTQVLQKQGLRGRALDQAMYAWSQKKLQSKSTAIH